MNTIEILKRDWAMDPLAAEHLASQMDGQEEDLLEQRVKDIPEQVKQLRDNNREQLNKAFDGVGIVAVLGACSHDRNVNYHPLFDFLGEIQANNPQATIALRLNGSKPRTSTGWRGTWASTISEEREALFTTYTEAMNRGIPIITEITDGPQLGELAPFLSGQWVGARDVDSTSLRHAFQGIQLATGIKNGMTADAANVSNAINTIRSDTAKNDGSGFNLGSIAGSPNSRGIPTGILPVGEGNPHTAIFARGYPLPKEMVPSERRKKAIEHLSLMCITAEMLNCAVLIDGTHSVAPMFAIEPKDPNRFLAVLHEIHSAINADEIQDSHRIRGIIGEVGPVSGRTDPNFIVNKETEKILSDMLDQTFDTIKQ